MDLLGLIDSIPGEDYGIPDNDPPDYYGHGTHVAGTIAGCTNNGIGIASGSFNVKQLAIRAAVAFTYNGTRTARGYSNDFVRAIQYVVNRQVRVISISFGGSTPDSSYQAVTEYARENGAIMFAAAGNSDSIEINYPAGYPNVISVASLRRGNLRSTFSNYGPTIGISAPGSSIWSTMTLQSNEATLYASWSGTSMATPNAASVAALIFSKNPSLTPAQVQQYLYQNATNISALNPGYQLGAGGVNAQRSIQATPRRPLLLVSPSARSDTIWLNRPDTIRWSDTQSNAIRIEWNRNFPYDAWQALLATTPNDGIHIWTPTGAELPHVRIRVISNTNILWNDRSDYSVPLMNPQLTIGAHSNVVAYHARDTIRWNMAGVNRVDVKWNRNYPMGSWDTIATNIPAANGQIVWTIPSLPTQHARIKVIDRRYPELSSLSPDDIAIVPPMLAWNDSLNSDSLWGGLPTTLYWDSFGVFGTLKLDIMIGYPTGNWSPIFEELPNTGNTTFMIPTSISNDHVRFRLQWNLDTSVTTITSRDIPITRATYRIVSPNGGENWGINEVHRIEWSSNNPATVLVQLNRTFPSGQWIPISDPVTNANSVLWSVTSPISGRCRVRVIPQSSTMVGDTSDANFQIGVSSVNLDENTIPGELILLSPQPNPANASVTLRFGLPTPLPVKVAIFNVHGQEIAEFPERMYTPGYHSISLNLTQRNGLHSSSGIFIVRVTSASRSYYTKGLYVK
ncbi:MAG: S8 family peptidase [bacterium]|nr:S8 family peptidase [bacterium]